MIYVMLFIALYAAWYFTFTAISGYTVGRECHTLLTSLDAAIPFVPEFEYVYILCYVIPLIPVVIIQEAAVMNRLIAAFVVINAVAFATFVLFPVYCPRPGFIVDSLAARLVSLEYSMDRPVNNFPSLHAAIAWLAFLGCRGRNTYLAVLLFLSAAGISVGSLFLKQHYCADIAAGTALSFLVYYGIERAVSGPAATGERLSCQ
jgi:membrane-associated phospholipid phosphatase